MSDQPEALRLADALTECHHIGVGGPDLQAAAELRRQHAEIESAHRAQREAENELSRALARHAMAEAELKAERDALRAALAANLPAVGMGWIDRAKTAEAERDAIKKLLDQHEAALKMWLEKTEWVQETRRHGELGLHRADVMHTRLINAESERNALRAELLSIGDLDKRHAIVRKWGLSEWADWAQNRARYATREEDRDE